MSSARTHAAARTLALALAVTAASIAPASAAATDDARAVANGRTIARALLVLRNPRVCIPLARVASCRSELAAFFGAFDPSTVIARVPNAAPRAYERLQRYIAEGDPSDIDPALAWLNQRRPSSGDERRAYFENVGIAHTMIASASDDRRMQLLGAMYLPAVAGSDDADGRRLLSTADRALIAGLGASDDARGHAVKIAESQIPALVAAEGAFANAVAARFPASASPTLAYEESPLGYFRLGVALTTLRVFYELPALAALPESRAFAHEALQRAAAVVPALASETEAAAAGLVSLDPATRNASGRAMAAIQRGIGNGAPHAMIPALLLGESVELVGEDAASARNDARETQMHAILAKFAPIAGLPDDVIRPIRALDACPAAGFACRRLAATAAVEAASAQ
jgi:hypothetical protein